MAVELIDRLLWKTLHASAEGRPSQVPGQPARGLKGGRTSPIEPPGLVVVGVQPPRQQIDIIVRPRLTRFWYAQHIQPWLSAAHPSLSADRALVAYDYISHKEKQSQSWHVYTQRGWWMAECRQSMQSRLLPASPLGAVDNVYKARNFNECGAQRNINWKKRSCPVAANKTYLIR